MRTRALLWSLTAAALIVLAAVPPAQAVLVELDGFVIFAGDNTFGITLDSQVNGFLTFNEAVAPVGGPLNFQDPNAGMSLDFNLGAFSFNTDANPFPVGFLDLTFGFSGGFVRTIDLLFATGTDGWLLNIGFDEQLGGANSFTMVGPNLDVVAGQVTIPEPGTLLLLASGLAAVAGAHRRLRTS